MTPQQLEEGYWRAHKEFYTWKAILRSACTKPDSFTRLRHVAYAAGWKKFEPLWDLILRAKRVSWMLPLLEAILEGGPERAASRPTRPETALASPYRQETGSASGGVSADPGRHWLVRAQAADSRRKRGGAATRNLH
jgi:hypothetical protein